MNILRVLVIFHLSVLAGFSSDDGTKERIDETLRPLDAMLKADPSGRTAQTYLNKEWLPSRTIQPYFYEVSQTLYESSPERDERVRKVEQWMAPYEQSLVRVLLASQNLAGVPNAAVVYLQFAAPTPALHDALLAVGRSPDALPQYAAEAYDSLFMLDLGDPEVAKEVIELIEERDAKSARSPVGGALMGKLTRWARPEMKNMYLELLSVSYKPENFTIPGGKARLTSNYQRSFEGLKAFGKLDDSVVSMMRERLSEVPLEEEPDFHRLARDPLLIAEGKLRPEPVVNLKGQLLGISQEAYPSWLAAHPDDEKIKGIRQAKRHPEERTNRLRNSASEIESSLNAPKDANRAKLMPLWLVLGIGSLVAILLYRLRKCKPGSGSKF